MRISDCIRINNCQNLKIIATMLSCYNDDTRDRYLSFFFFRDGVNLRLCRKVTKKACKSESILEDPPLPLLAISIILVIKLLKLVSSSSTSEAASRLPRRYCAQSLCGTPLQSAY